MCTLSHPALQTGCYNPHLQNVHTLSSCTTDLLLQPPSSECVHLVILHYRLVATTPIFRMCTLSHPALQTGCYNPHLQNVHTLSSCTTDLLLQPPSSECVHLVILHYRLVATTPIFRMCTLSHPALQTGCYNPHLQNVHTKSSCTTDWLLQPPSSECAHLVILHYRLVATTPIFRMCTLSHPALQTGCYNPHLQNVHT